MIELKYDKEIKVFQRKIDRILKYVELIKTNGVEGLSQDEVDQAIHRRTTMKIPKLEKEIKDLDELQKPISVGLVL
ncbi:unnamed protein product [marine sediment metagenome]|uniref:Uncharacterized protein n=1 Tax=marine sediment metagenome TaxID=412755 RepID=X1B1D7_9ZZZZ